MKFYLIMSHIFFFLGDMASKPLNMDWAQEDGPKTEWLTGAIYSVYNWLMLKSVDFNDLCDGDVWGPCEWPDDDDIDDEDDKFTPITLRKDEK